MKTLVGWADKYNAGVCSVDAAGRAEQTLGHIEIRKGENNYSIVISDINGGYLAVNSRKKDGFKAARLKGEILSQFLEAGLAA